MFRVGSALSAAITSCFAFGLLAVPAGAAQADRCPGSLDAPIDQQGLARAADALVCLVNAERTDRGLKPLKADVDLAQAARRHTNDMVQRSYFAHTSPLGDSVGDRVRAAGYGDPRDGWLVGENLAWGTGQRATPNWVVDAWLNSDGHRRIMLRAEYREFGVGVAAGAPKQTTSGRPGATFTLDLGVLR
jgi:uncharacterized protein YkwD